MRPASTPLGGTGRALSTEAVGLETSAPSEAASRHFQASLFYDKAGLADESARARSAAFSAVQKAVAARTLPALLVNGHERPASGSCLTVSAPARIDFGGGWSDTPPFCLDWGGTVFNMAVTLNGSYPIRTNRHWQLNQILDPHTSNAPINSLLERVRPYISGAKLAGARRRRFPHALGKNTRRCPGSSPVSGIGSRSGGFIRVGSRTVGAAR